MILSRILISLIVVGVVSGCAVGPDYHRPASQLPDHYLGHSAKQLGQAPDEAELVAWWSKFDDPQLTRYITLALERNLDLAQAAARVTQSRAGLGAASAALAPSGTISGQAGRAYQSLETPLGQVLSAQPGFERYGSSYEANLGVGWELDLFGGLRRGREAALAEYQSSAAAATATRLAVAAQTADLYIGVRGLQTRLGIARHQLETQQRLLDMLNLLHSKELVAELQVRQAEGALALVQATIPVLEAELETTMNALDVMLGVAPGTYRQELAEPRAVPSAPRLIAIGEPADLLRRRPDLIAAERRLAASNARIGMAIAEYYPKFSLSGTVGSATSISGGNLFSGGADQRAALLGLRWRLFDFGRIDAEINLAKGQQAEALASYRLYVLRAAGDVENAAVDLFKREEQARVLKQGEESLTRAREAAFSAYGKGVVSLIEVMHADETLLRASDARAQAQTASALAAVAAFKALGGGWDFTGSNAVAQR